MGDSTLIIGAIEGIAYGPDGNIAILDCALACVRIYSPEGKYLRQKRRGFLQSSCIRLNAACTAS